MRKATGENPEMRFSFKLFDNSDAEMCPAAFEEGYTQTLMERLRDISRMKVREFTSSRGSALRSHEHDWSETTRPKGFEHLSEQFRAYPGWQFALSANKHGRVHGIIVGDTFHVIWLDRNHALYP